MVYKRKGFSIIKKTMALFLAISLVQIGTAYSHAAANPGDMAIVPIAAGNDYSLAVKTDGTIWGWGNNRFNQLGTGETTSGAVTAAVQTANIDQVVAVSAGRQHSLALKEDGTVWAWGHNAVGQLGQGTPTSEPPYSMSKPVQVANLKDVAEVAAGDNFSLALKKDGTVWSWGQNYEGTLGDGTTVSRFSPVLIESLTDVVSIATRGIHSLAVKSDGTVWGWGYNGKGQLGDGNHGGAYGIYNEGIDQKTPVRVMQVEDNQQIESAEPLQGVVSVAAGLGHSLALKIDGTVWAWGRNDQGQLGNGTWLDSFFPTRVENLDHVIAITAGHDFSLALKSDGSVWAWGRGQHGQLGQFSEVTGATTAAGEPSKGYNIIEGASHPLDSNTPIQIEELSNISAIAAGELHGMALTESGLLWTPHGMELYEDGLLWTWGYNDYGQIGNGYASTRGYPLDNVKTYPGGGPPDILGSIMQPNASYPSTWAVPEIASAMGYGLTTVKVLSNYRQPITREVFCELAIKLYEAISGQKAQPAPANTFDDTANPEILKAYKLGIVNGVGEKQFAPVQPVTREQIALMFYRTMKNAKPGLQTSSLPVPTFADNQQIASWAREAVADMSTRGIIGGVGGGSFDPKGSATREQAIALVKRVYEYFENN